MVTELATASRIASIVLYWTAWASLADSIPVDDPKSSTVSRTEQGPISIYLNAPADRETLWKMLGRPDLVILDGEVYRQFLALKDSTAKTSPALPTWVIESLTVTGQATDDWARLSLDYEIALETDETCWVPIHLDGLNLSEVVEKNENLPARMIEGNSWQLKIQGKGMHKVRVQLLAPIRTTADGKQLVLKIPPVASSRIELIVPPLTVEASAGNGELIMLGSDDQGGNQRLSGRLSPRPRLDLRWRTRNDTANHVSVLLSTQATTLIEIEGGFVRTRNSWLVTSLRGTTNRLSLRIDPNEEIIDLEVGGKTVQVDSRREPGQLMVSIPLNEPLVPNSDLSVLLTTRRTMATNGPVRLTLKGQSFDHAKIQTGKVAIARAGPIFLNPRAARGLRRIDPRTDLPDLLRNNPETVLAYEITDQPFDLDLGIEPETPQLRVENKTTIYLNSSSGQLFTRLDCRISQGRMPEIHIIVPKDLDFENVSPAEFVESARIVPIETSSAVSPEKEMNRRLTISLTPRAIEAGSFYLQLRGKCSIDFSRLVSLPLYHPETPFSEGGRYVIVTERNVDIELAGPGDEGGGFRTDRAKSLSDWTWPSQSPGPDQGVLCLRSEIAPTTMPLRAKIRTRSINHETTTTASVDRRGVDIIDEITGEVAFGSISRMDIAVPRVVGDHWAVEGSEKTTRELLDADPVGPLHFRLRFAREFTDAFRIRIRYRIPFESPGESANVARLHFEPIQILEGISTGKILLISADPGIELQAEAKGWAVFEPSLMSMVMEKNLPIKIALKRQDGSSDAVDIKARFGPQASLPDLIATRLWIKTYLRADNEIASTASFWVESHGPSLAFALPPGSNWVRARMGSIDVGKTAVETLAPDEYRIQFPGPNSTVPVLVSIEYTTPANAWLKNWPVLKLLEHSVVQQTVWQVNMLGTRAGIGTPQGWMDENGWRWDGLIWRRQPWKDEEELSTWLTGGNNRLRPIEASEVVEHTSRHSYLFSRSGPPVPLQFTVISRSTLLLYCSGPVLLSGLLCLFRRPSPRWFAASILVLAFVTIAMVDWSIVFLIFQSSTLGIALFAMAWAIQWAIERRSFNLPVGGGNAILAPSAIASSMFQAATVGADESTAIRPRVLLTSAVSTADHVLIERAIDDPVDEKSSLDRESS